MNGFDITPPALPSAQTDITVYLNQLFASDTKAFAQLAYEIQREFRFGGSPDVSRIVIDRVSYDAASASGRFRVVLDIDFTFGCEDVRTQKQDQTSEWTFKIDAGKNIIHFSGSPYAESRSTADEF